MVTELEAKFSQKIAICFACDDKYVPYFSVALASLQANSDNNKNYDIIILSEDISEENKTNILSCEKTNFKIRFFNMKEYLNTFDTKVFYIGNGSRYTVHTYYRFFITDIFRNYNKVIYLDSDLILLDDISKLYDIDMTNNYVAATKDIYLPMFVKINPKFYRYHKNVLKLSELRNYFQAGVLMFNIPYCSENNFKNKLFDTLSEIKTPLIVDQDILNKVCEHKVKYIDGKWNFDTNVTLLCKYNKKLLKLTYKREDISLIKEIMKKPKIIHFAGPVKPWNDFRVIYAFKYWKYIFKSKYKKFFVDKYINQERKKFKLLSYLYQN
ncbi:glycosyltransferase family 8 protein [bacterium]|nr:glycosyltransferase family 8 protein [bacterium]